jgi:hypothetical protein
MERHIKKTIKDENDNLIGLVLSDTDRTSVVFTELNHTNKSVHGEALTLYREELRNFINELEAKNIKITNIEKPITIFFDEELN